jgi:hypothetical protein
MSRIWKRSLGECFCGYCVPNRRIALGEPAVFIRIGTTRELIRCQDCAGEKAPEDLPELLEAGGIETSGFSHIGKAAPGRTRGKLKAAVKEWMPYREAGEEG